MAAGLVSALVAEPSATLAVLEVDEAHLPGVAELVRPELIVLLNLSRDQLDRTNEVRMLASKWREGIPPIDCRIVANADDPLVVWAAETSAEVVWVAAGGRWHEDAYHCPRCDARIEFSNGSNGSTWSCSCGFSRPQPSFILTDEGLIAEDGSTEQVALQLPGRFNRANAAMAAVAAHELGVGIAAALESMREISDVAGRFAPHDVGGRKGTLMLAKNPAGWTELIDLVEPEHGPVVIGINSRIADGHDPSWLWDVPFERLSEHTVIATGERRHDLGVRLLHAGVPHLLADDAVGALRDFDAGTINFIGNYTAFQDTRRSLQRITDSQFKPLGQLELARSVAIASAETPDASRQGPRRTSANESRLRIVIVHPDLLGTYGDAGNGLILANRALWRDIPVELILAPSDVPLPRRGDLYCLGGGEDGPQVRAAATLADGVLRQAIHDGAAVLAVCAGFQILGQSFPGIGGALTRGLDLLDVTTTRGDRRAVGELLIEAQGGQLLSGFENHAGRTGRGNDAEALGAVRVGIGNGDSTDGVRSGRIIGTYLHGPVLARNSWLADELLELVIDNSLAALDDHEERELTAERLRAVADLDHPLKRFRHGLLRGGLRELVSR